VPALLAVRGDGDPVRVRIVDVLVGRMRVGSRDNVHAELAAARYQFAEAITVAEEFTAVM